MTVNNISLAANTADIELTGYGPLYQTYGFQLAPGTTITEARGSGFAGQVSSGAPTYQDAAPYQRMAFEQFGGGFGQLQYNRVFGGNGQGGDPTRYFYSDGWTLNGSAILPGMARNLIQPGSGPGPATNSEFSMPRGILPAPAETILTVQFTTTRAITVDTVRFLLKMGPRNTASTMPVVNIKDNSGTILATWSTPVANYNLSRGGWQWTGIKGGSTLSLASTTTYKITVNMSTVALGVVIGCFAGTVDGVNNQLCPYFQLTSSGADFFSFSGSIVKTEKLNNAGTTVPVVITGISMFSVPIGGSATAERALAGNYTGSIVFDNKLYIGYTGGVAIWDAATAASAGAAPNTNTNIALGPAIAHNGIIYFIPSNSPNEVATYDGGNTSTATIVIGPNTVGKASTNSQNNLNNLFIYRGLLYIFKPEGIYQVYDDPSKLNTTNPARIYQVVNFGDYEHPDNCKWLVEHQGVLYFNVRNMVYRLDMTQGVSQVSVLVPPWPLYGPKYFCYVNGLASDGQVLYMSYANQGIVAFNGSGYHLITEFYNLFFANGLGSGLKVVIDGGAQTGPNYIYCGDNQHLLRIPLPTYNATYGQQISLQDQNKCFVWASSIWDADLAEVIKNIKSAILRAFPPQDETNNPQWQYKLVLGLYQTTNSRVLNYRSILQTTIDQGIIWDKWISPSDWLGVSAIQTGSAYWTQSDFNNQNALSEKNASADEVGFYVNMVSGCFVLYGWNPTGSQYTGTYANTEPTYVDALVIKHLPILDYLARYQMTIDLDALLTDAAPLNSTGFQNAEDFLRTLAALHSPVSFSFRDTTGRIRTVNCIMEQFRTEYEGATTAIATGDQPNRKANLSLIATNAG